MSSQIRMRMVGFLAAYAGMIALTGLWAQDSPPKREAVKPEVAKKANEQAASATCSVKAKPLSENVKKSLAYLAQQQHANGGWSQGEESAQMGASGNQVKDLPNVADTCMATLATFGPGIRRRKGYTRTTS